MLFEAGTTCDGTLTPAGSGASGNPIVISDYGTGALPIIDADGGTEAVLLTAESYITVQNLELEAPGNNETPERGVYVYADSGASGARRSGAQAAWRGTEYPASSDRTGLERRGSGVLLRRG